jgi:light-regulated signal transduction histidine kinase (bacteriophytochrome)
MRTLIVQRNAIAFTVLSVLREHAIALGVEHLDRVQVCFKREKKKTKAGGNGWGASYKLISRLALVNKPLAAAGNALDEG